MSAEILDDVIRAQKDNLPRGITSICSAHPYVLMCALRHAIDNGLPLLIESTCNQVNQFGGYTGMTPTDFVSLIQRSARENGFPMERVILGGDHLGPSVWQDEPAEVALQKSERLVHEYVRAGYEKIHLDASMRLGGDDPSRPLDIQLSCERAARLMKVAEDAFVQDKGHDLPRYVIGTEVPIPGGAQASDEDTSITPPANVRQTLDMTHQATKRLGLESAWARVIAIVVQPGVEFGDDFVLDYQTQQGRQLKHFIEAEPHIVYEVHSTDYQTRAALRNLVRDHFAIMKVGPRLTFALREAVFSLAFIEDELTASLPAETRSNIVATLDAAMMRAPQNWQKHYRGTSASQQLARKYSFSDRIRYYWQDTEVQAAFDKLMANLGQKALPLSLLSQFAPSEFVLVRQGTLSNTPAAIVLNRIRCVLDDYAFACAADE